MIDIDVDVTEDKGIADLFAVFNDDQMQRLNSVALQAALNYVREYHRNFGAKGGWENKGLSTHGAGRRSTKFAQKVATGWRAGNVTASGATMSNFFPLLPIKITGGTIKPKRANYLTIPLVPEAHGVRAKDYTGKLFPNKKKTVLMESDGNGGVTSVYALKKSVEAKPVKGAMPSSQELSQPFIEAILDNLDGIL